MNRRYSFARFFAPRVYMIPDAGGAAGGTSAATNAAQAAAADRTTIGKDYGAGRRRVL